MTGVVGDGLKEVFEDFRAAYAKWIDSTKEANLCLMQAWKAGYIDELWAELRADFPGCYLTYFIRARGLGDIKIGKSKQVKVRLRGLYTAASRGLDLVACYPAPGNHEKELKDEFAHLRLCGEWYRAKDDLLDHLRLIGCDPSTFTNELPPPWARSEPEKWL